MPGVQCLYNHTVLRKPRPTLSMCGLPKNQKLTWIPYSVKLLHIDDNLHHLSIVTLNV